MDKEIWNDAAEKYRAYFEDSKKRVSIVNIFPRILQIIGNIRGKKMLDYGCGQGRFSRILYDMGAEITAYDSAEKELEIAKNLNDNRDIFYSSHINEIPKEQFDIVLCFMVLLCNDKERVNKVLREIYYFIRSGGCCIFVNTNTETIGKKFKDFYSEVRGKYFSEGDMYITIIPTSKGNMVVYDHYYSKEFLSGIFEKHGFKMLVEEVIAKQFVLHVVSKS